jgi:hypothetical protein
MNLYSTTASPSPSKNPKSNTDNSLASFLSKNDFTPSLISPNHCISSEGNQNELKKNNNSNLKTNPTTHTTTDATSNCSTTVETPYLPSPLPPVDLTPPPTVPACPFNLDVAAIGSLTVENDNSNSMDAQLAPEYSQDTLDYYNDIQDYLQHLNKEGTEKKKKKKKKKKTFNSESDPSLSSPVASSTDTAVETTTAMGEEGLNTLKRKKDNPILFYV